MASRTLSSHTLQTCPGLIRFLAESKYWQTASTHGSVIQECSAGLIFGVMCLARSNTSMGWHPKQFSWLRSPEDKNLKNC